jgi:hypothetical protein
MSCGGPPSIGLPTPYWMAMEALESEADPLRVIVQRSDGSPDLAYQAEKDARVLRELAMAHTRQE